MRGEKEKEGRVNELQTQIKRRGRLTIPPIPIPIPPMPIIIGFIIPMPPLPIPPIPIPPIP